MSTREYHKRDTCYAKGESSDIMSVRKVRLKTERGMPMDDVRFIATRLAEKMKEYKLDDKKLAEKTKISRSTIYYLRNGRDGRNVTTSAQNLAKIAEVLRTSPEYFIDEDADPSPNQKKMSALVADIVGMADELSPVHQRELRELANALVEMEHSATVESIYNDLMDSITRLAELKGGKALLKDLLDYLESISSGTPTPSVARRSRRGRTPKDGSESATKPSQGAE